MADLRILIDLIVNSCRVGSAASAHSPLLSFRRLCASFLQVPDRPIERQQHQAALGCSPAIHPSIQRVALRGLQLPAAGRLEQRGDAPSATLQTRCPL